MAASNLLQCLNSLNENSNNTNEITFIDTHHGNLECLDYICGSIDENLVYDRDRTELQPNRCKDGRTATLFPSSCGPLDDSFSMCVKGCERNCTVGYDGFYCRGKVFITKN